jgi:hypothetical protein
MNANKGISSVFSVSYRDEKIRNKLLDLQFNLWKETKVRHSMEQVLNLLLDTYEKQKK